MGRSTVKKMGCLKNEKMKYQTDENIGCLTKLMKIKTNRRRTSSSEVITGPAWYLVPVQVDSKIRVDMKFSSQDIHKVRDAFAMYDKRSDGTIPTKCFISVMRALGHNVTEEQTNDIIFSVDYNQSGVIHFMEFVEVWAKYTTEFDSAIIKEAFEMFDKDFSGKIDVEEFRQVVMTAGKDFFLSHDVIAH